MSLFQKTVINKYTQALNTQMVQDAYSIYKAYFLNPSIQENIRASKEEQFQEGFLRVLFGNILGYTLNPYPDFNLTTELKNTSNNKKVDGAIIIDNKAIAVIELKGTETTDLSKIENQAFSYKNNQPYCTYIITSNFEKLRFYIDNAIEFIEFNLFTLSRDDFNLLWLCLSFKNIKQNIPKKIKEESLSQEDVITKLLYKDYSLFKRELFQNLLDLNPQFEPLTLFKKSQKLLDRFLFLLFAEDRLLLPPNSVRLILNDWKDLKERDEVVPLYNRFKKYFGYLNTGYKGKRYNVFAYNGGLFKADEILDKVKINDELLYKHTLKLSKYDFASEIDVNILGHIFENSLNELDEIKAQLEGNDVDKNETKRKKDGVFYTPKYITKYIVDNTVGKLCLEKKAEFLINDEDYISDKKRQKKTIQELADKLISYRNWLLQITICDPACGSGAFLNQALDFLISEHKYIDELQAKLFGDALVLSNFENSILENNLFGVDVNEESVEIAKLSLWLRTAQPNRKLNDLSNNIKCGNSLIDNPAIAGEKAFNWFIEFPQVFPSYKDKNKNVNYDIKKKIIESGVFKYPDQGDNNYNDELSEPAFSYKAESKGFEKHGFDVIIGNPPYVVLSPLFLKPYRFTKGNNNTYIAFIELGLNIIKDSGELGFIIPNTWFGGDNFIELREFLIKEANLRQIIQLPYDIFNAYIDTSIVLINKLQLSAFTDYYKYDIRDNQNNIVFKNLVSFPKSNWSKYGKIFLNYELLKIGEKVWFSSKNILLGSISKINRGSLPPNEKEKSNVKSDYFNIKWFDNQVFRYTEEINKDVFVNYESLRENKNIEVYKGKRIFGRQLMSRQFRMNLTIINNDCAFKKNIYAIYGIDEKFSYEFILAVLNSKLFSFSQVNFNTSLQRDDFPAFSLMDFKNFAIPNINISLQQPFIEKANLMLSLNKELQKLSQEFQRFIQSELGLESIPNKLQNWYLISYSEFIKELEKKKIKLKLSQKAEWERCIFHESKKALALKSKIETTDKEIDRMVYELYGLTEEEIIIVEKNYHN